MKLKILTALAFIGILGCNPAESQKSQQIDLDLSQEFRNYWYDGTAELTRYKLEQARYGEIHEGDAVLIYVTEEFRTDKQVKYEGGDRKNVAPILKLNSTKTFNTGVYPYSLMSSIFSRLDQNELVKVTTSCQDWCGHSFTQLNKQKGDAYKISSFSYFQSEGDQEVKVAAPHVEDDVWVQIRKDPSVLPTGKIKMLIGTQFSRMKHDELKAYSATASHSKTGTTNSYTIDYPELNRTLVINYESSFPYTILGWEETLESGFGSNKKVLTTRATMTHQIKSPYWSKHGLEDAGLRKELGLD